MSARRWCARFGAVLVCALLVGACTSDDDSQATDPVRDDDGQVLDSTEVDALRVQVGDCFNGTIPFAVETIDAVPCDEPHDQQAYAVFDLDPTPDPAADAGEGDEEGEEGDEQGDDTTTTSSTVALEDEEWPGDARVQELGERGCLVAFGAYVGNAYETSVLEIGLILPTADSWEALDDREVVCTAYRADGAQLTESIEGSGL